MSKPETRNETEESMLLYLEHCMVDGLCLVSSEKLNGEDKGIMVEWEAQGLLTTGRVKSAELRRVGPSKYQWCFLGPELLERALAIRKERALRFIARRKAGEFDK